MHHHQRQHDWIPPSTAAEVLIMSDKGESNEVIQADSQERPRGLKVTK